MQREGFARYDKLNSVAIDAQERGEGGRCSDGRDAPLTYLTTFVGPERRLVLLRDIKPSEVILQLSPASLINVRTLEGFLCKELLPSPGRQSHASNWKSTKTATTTGSSEAAAHGGEAKLPLTSVQSLTLLLASWRSSRQRRRETQNSSVEAEERLKVLDEVLCSFPASYSSFPLTWKVLSTTDERLAAMAETLLDALPTHVSHMCKGVHDRFVKDCQAIESVQQHAPQLFTYLGKQIDSIDAQDLLWAWCSVNSRCVYVPLGLTPHLDNFTLAPLLDMANHTTESKIECKVKWTSTGGLQLSAPAKSSNSAGLKKWQEVMITYGAHSNGFLLSEYGFTLCDSHRVGTAECSPMTKWTGNPFAEVRMDEVVEELLQDPSMTDRAGKIELLREQNYYGDYTIHPHPQPTHPSYRLIVALRLLAIADVNTGTDEVKSWKDMINGAVDMISRRNEAAVHSILLTACHKMRQKLQIKKDHLSKMLLEDFASVDMTVNDIKSNTRIVQDLLDEEEHILCTLEKAIQQGQTDW